MVQHNIKKECNSVLKLDWLLRLSRCTGTRSFNDSFFIMQISDHKRKTWALCHFCGNPVQRKRNIYIPRISNRWISHANDVPRSYLYPLQRCSLKYLNKKWSVDDDGFAKQAMTGSMNSHFFVCAILCTKLLTEC